MGELPPRTRLLNPVDPRRTGSQSSGNDPPSGSMLTDRHSSSPLHTSPVVFGAIPDGPTTPGTYTPALTTPPKPTKVSLAQRGTARNRTCRQACRGATQAPSYSVLLARQSQGLTPQPRHTKGGGEPDNCLTNLYDITAPVGAETYLPTPARQGREPQPPESTVMPPGMTPEHVTAGPAGPALFVSCWPVRANPADIQSCRQA